MKLKNVKVGMVVQTLHPISIHEGLIPEGTEGRIIYIETTAKKTILFVDVGGIVLDIGLKDVIPPKKKKVPPKKMIPPTNIDEALEYWMDEEKTYSVSGKLNGRLFHEYIDAFTITDAIEKSVMNTAAITGIFEVKKN